MFNYELQRDKCSFLYVRVANRLTSAYTLAELPVDNQVYIWLHQAESEDELNWENAQVDLSHRWSPRVVARRKVNVPT